LQLFNIYYDIWIDNTININTDMLTNSQKNLLSKQLSIFFTSGIESLNLMYNLSASINKLKDKEKKIQQLEEEIVELKARPPGIGGPDYEKAKADFEELS
jgi:nitrogen-specific signal transduction histidine kinase